MKKIKRFDPKGIQPSEVVGIADLERARLPSNWFGYANLSIKGVNELRAPEIDLFLVTHDRILLVDFKHWHGKVTSRERVWLLNGNFMEHSPVLKISNHARRLSGMLRSIPQLDEMTLPVDSFVVFTAKPCDFAELPENDRKQCKRIGEFIDILASETRYDRLFVKSRSDWSRQRPLGEDVRSAIDAFFNGPLFEATEAKFSGYKPDPEPDFEHREKIYSEYSCDLESNAYARGLLRLWDFGAMPAELSVAEKRREFTERESLVTSYLSSMDPDLRTALLQPAAKDTEVGIRYWEIFSLQRSAVRLRDYLKRKSPSPERRLDLCSLILERCARLHRYGVAHRDISENCIWFEEQHTTLQLSSLMSAYFPETTTVGTLRGKLTSAARLPEDDKGTHKTDPFRGDVYLLALVCWHTLTEHGLDAIDGIPVLNDSDLAKVNLPEAYHSWFQRALNLDPSSRYASAVEMHEAFLERRKSAQNGKVSAAQYKIHESSTPAFLRFPVHKTLKEGNSVVWMSACDDQEVVVKYWTNVPILDSASASQVAVAAFFDRVRDLEIRPATWCPRIVTAGYYGADLFVVQEYVGGKIWSETISEVGDVDDAFELCCKLIRAVHDMHAQGMYHGDLKPDNIVVRGDESRSVVFLDLIEYLPAGLGEAMNSAYSPPSGDADAATRDRYAVCKLIEEMLVLFEVEPTDDDTGPEALLREARSSAFQDPQWASIDALKAVVDRTHALEKLPSATLHIGCRGPLQTAALKAVGNQFDVVVETAPAPKVSIVALEQVLEVVLDAACTRVVDIRLLHRRGASNWSHLKRNARFRGRITLYEAVDFKVDEVSWVLALPDIKAALEPKLTTSPNVASREESGETEALRSLPLEDLWQATLDVEEETLRPIVLTAEPQYDSVRDIYWLRADFSWDNAEFENEVVEVSRAGKRVGFLDTNMSLGSGMLPVRDLQWVQSFKVGDRLTLQTSSEKENLARRRRAIERIVKGEAKVSNLVQYFEPQSKLEPFQFAAPDLDVEQLKKDYELNDDQVVAFEKVWSTGPLTLLQGPPGTGKTSFIAALVHHGIRTGAFKNVLICSQSHEGVDNVAARLQEMFDASTCDEKLVRVGLETKVSPEIITLHSSAIQGRYREIFISERKGRILALSKSLGVSEEFADHLYDLDEKLEFIGRIILHEAGASRARGALERALAYLSLIESELRTHANARFHDAIADLKSALTAESSTSGQDEVTSEEALSFGALNEELLSALMVLHGETNRRSVSQLRRLFALSKDWIAALRGRARTLDGLFARTRPIVMGTCVGIGRRSLGIDTTAFDLVVIDEAARCTAGELAVAMQSGCRVLLVGDQQQLAPFSEPDQQRLLAERLGLEREVLLASDFQRAFESPYGRKNGHRFRLQYRMAPAISDLVATCFYPKVELKADRKASPAFYALLPEMWSEPVTWLDTSDAGTASHETPLRATARGALNPYEVDIVLKALTDLAGAQEFWAHYDAQEKREERPIGVVCMYARQRDELRANLPTIGLPMSFLSRVKVDTVDSYQGKENSIIIASLVRNNPYGRVGFLGDLRRINVALSRARERLVLVGSKQFFQRHAVSTELRSVANYIDAHAGRGYKTVDSRLLNAK